MNSRRQALALAGAVTATVLTQAPVAWYVARAAGLVAFGLLTLTVWLGRRVGPAARGQPLSRSLGENSEKVRLLGLNDKRKTPGLRGF